MYCVDKRLRKNSEGKMQEVNIKETVKQGNESEIDDDLEKEVRF